MKKKVTYDLLGERAPQLPENLPHLLTLAVENVPAHMKAATMNSIFPAMGALMQGVTFRYPDNVVHEPHFMCGMVGPQSVGKGSINPIIETIIRPLREHDVESNNRLNEWKKRCRSLGANKEKPERPAGVAILVPEPDMTNPALIQLLMDAEAEGDRCLYTSMPEVDLLDQCCGSHKKVTKVIRLAYDQARLGAQRVSADGISGNPVCRWNINFSCVEQKARQFFRDSLLDGTLSRIGISYVQRPDNRSGIIPRQGIYDEEYRLQMEAYMVRLRAAHGEIACHQANLCVQRLAKEMAECTVQFDDENFEDLSFRALVIAWLKTCVLYVANGYKWTSAMADFMRWSLYYDLWSKLALFAPELGRLSTERVDTRLTRKKGPTNWLDLIPGDSFTRSDLLELHRRAGKDEEKAGRDADKLLRIWADREYICYCAQTGLYGKTELYKSR